MLKGKDFVIVGQQPWDTGGGSNCKDIALELSKYNRVLYVNSALDRITLLRNGRDPKVRKRFHLTRSKGENLLSIKNNLWNYYPDCIVESINWINVPGIFDSLNRRNSKLFSESIIKALRSLDFTDFILFNDSEILKGFYLSEYLRPHLSIYYSRDNMVAVNYWQRHGGRLEPELIRKSDLCFSNSEYLASYCRRYNVDSFDVGQGCNFEPFLETSHGRPQDIPNDERPIIGYVGALIRTRLDIRIIRMLAEEFSQAYVILIGAPDEDFLESRLQDIQNVLFLGHKESYQIPSYIHVFDVCINPQVVNDLTIGNYPRKIDEYLSLGKPTVATRTKKMEDFDGLVYLADSPRQFIKSVKIALREDNLVLQNERKSFAFSHSWENSVFKMYQYIEKKLTTNI